MPRWAIDITAGTGGFEAATKRIPASTKKATDKATRVHQSAADKSAAAWSSALKVAGGIAMVAGLGMAWKSFTQDVIDTRNELSDTALRMAQTTDTVEALRLAAEGTGQEFGPVAKAIEKLPKLLADADAGLSTAVRAFKNLNIETHDAQGNIRDASDVFDDFRKEIDKIEDPTLRAARAADLFGAKAGGKMLQALQGGADHFEVLRREAHEFGVNTGPEAMQAASDMQRDFARLGLVFRGAKADLLDAFGSGAGEGLDVLTHFGSAIRYNLTLLKGYSNLETVGFLDTFNKDEWKRWGEDVGQIFIDAKDAAENYYKLTDEERRTAEGASAAVAALGDEIETATRKTREAADPAKEHAKALREIESIRSQSAADTLSAEDKILDAYNNQLLALSDIGEKQAGVWDEIATAATAAEERMYRELDTLREEEAAKVAAAREKSLAADRAAADERIAMERRVTDAKLSIASYSADALLMLSDLIAQGDEEGGKKGVAAAKVAGVAKVVVDAAGAVMGSWDAYADIPFVGPILAGAQSALIAGIAGVQSAKIASAYTGLDLGYSSSTGTVTPVVTHPGEMATVHNRSEVEKASRGGSDSVPEVMLDGRPIGRSWARQVRRGGIEAREVRARTGKLGHKRYT